MRVCQETRAPLSYPLQRQDPQSNLRLEVSFRSLQFFLKIPSSGFLRLSFHELLIACKLEVILK